MALEIEQQIELLDEKSSHWQRRAETLREPLAERTNLAVVGRGSSGNACIYTSYVYGRRTGRHAIEFRPWISVHTDVDDVDWSDTAVLAFSASGKSTDVSHAAEWLRERGAFVVGITNADSEKCHLGEAASTLFFLDAGDEVAVPATKTFTAQLFAGAALSGYTITDASLQAAEAMHEFDQSSTIERLVDFVDGARTVSWLGRGPTLGAALDAALKLRETAQMQASAWSAAEFQHGFLGALGADDRVITFSDIDDPGSSLQGVASALLARESPHLVIGIGRDDHASPRPPVPVSLPDERWARAPVFAYLSQKVALEMAKRRGLNPDSPADLNKVTETM